jgi:hypothetical protein
MSTCLSVSSTILELLDSDHYNCVVYSVFCRNAETIPQFWADWNIPAHKWARQHVFKPMLRAGYSKLQAAVVVFIISAFFHEVLIGRSHNSILS